MIYEVREYVPTAGRLGDVVDLFKTEVVPLFKKHEMELVHVGFTTLGDNSFNELIYTMRFRDLAELETKWAAFIKDPQWDAAFSKREKSGPLYQAIRRRVTDAGPFEELLT
ncbi:NIPSNAP family protein [Nocardioides sp. YIM B13467]|uniref:NIPSNAP family protein n=1 Tax=Nocardioides sp. YIM B13467 TaxID=3366294 RepID=UPI00366D3A14